MFLGTGKMRKDQDAYTKALYTTFFVVLAFQVLFIFHPLRLGIDAVRMLDMALPAAMGGSYGQDQFPPFYPHLLCWLMRFGVCNVFVLYGINFIALWGAYVVLWMVFKKIGLGRCLSLCCITAMAFSTYLLQYCISIGTDILTHGQFR